MTTPNYPALYQINTRVWLTDLTRQLGRPATLDDIPDDDLDHLADMGFDWIWLLSVWQTGPGAQRVSRSNAAWRHEFQETLTDLREEDIAGSGFAITGYDVHADLGGDPALARLRTRMQRRNLKLMLDFVPNHVGLDHPWLEQHPEYFIAGSELDLARAPTDYTWVRRKSGDLLLAHGRDPYFPGWPDTLQLNYANSAMQEAMIQVLEKICGQCDGVRCDMAMLNLPEVFERTWGLRPEPFWPTATERVRQKTPGFLFMAEVYWDLEWALQQQGFDYTYDKRLYDRLREQHARPVREHLMADMQFQNKLARFLENHDEPRAATTFSPEVHQAAAAITFLSPGMRFFHQGQFEGWQKRISPHLVRAPGEPVNPDIKQFYDRLLTILRQRVVREGRWRLLECHSAWDGNGTNDDFIAFAWECPGEERLLIAVNYAPHQSQCRLRLPFTDLAGPSWRLHDQIGGVSYDRDGAEMQDQGLFLDQGPWQTAIWSLKCSTCVKS